MLKRIISALLCAILTTLFFGIGRTSAQTLVSSESAKVKEKVLSIGIGRSSKVEVKLKNNSRIKGYVSGNGADNFTVTNLRTGKSEVISYADVSKVKKPGGLSTTAWIIIGGAAAAALIVGFTVIKPILCDGC